MYSLGKDKNTRTEVGFLFLRMITERFDEEKGRRRRTSIYFNKNENNNNVFRRVTEIYD